MKRFIIMTTALLTLIGGVYAADFPMGAETSDGQPVTLNEDNTWEYMPVLNKPSTAKKVLKSKKKFVEIWYDSNKWKETEKPLNGAAEFSMIHQSGGGYSVMIIEKIEMELDVLKTTALTNAKKVAKDARVTYDEITQINGENVLVMDIKGTIEGIKFVYHSAYWSGPEGVFQIITYTSADLFDKYFEDFEELLAGIVVKTKNK
ncbi:MAG: hypothetical protein ABUK01_03430 [Leptospirales bacterium]